MRLEFDDGRFVLHGYGDSKSLQLLPKQFWLKNYANNTYVTKNTNEAARFKSVAVGKAKVILSKLILKAIPFPAGGIIAPNELSLRPFQEKQGIPFILTRNHSYLAHDPGLGKCAQSICAVNSKPGLATIVCPSYLKTTWAREIVKWSSFDFPHTEIVPESNKQHLLDWNADFLIVPDSMLIKPWVVAGLMKRKTRFLFIDEGHRFKEPGTARTVALFGGKITDKVKGQTVLKLQSPGIVYSPEHVCVLSGTPMPARPIELWPVLYALAPETIDFMSYDTFGFKFCGATRNDRGNWLYLGSNNEAELHRRLTERFMQRIRKEDVLPELPDKVREVIVLDNSGLDVKTKKLDFAMIQTMNTQKLETPESLADYAILRHEIGLAKCPQVAAYVLDIMSTNPDESVILFAHHRDVVDNLATLLFMFHPLIINGGVDQATRTKYEDLFQKGKRRLIIGNLDAMSLGLTLTKATRVIFAEYSPTPSVNEQGEDRAHRIGQLDTVFAQYLVFPNSIDEIFLQIILKKMKTTERVINGKN